MAYKCALLLAVSLGWLIAYVDSRPHWDDTGITAGLMFVVSFFCAALFPKRPWLWALAVGTGVPVMAMITSQNYGGWLALAIAFAGAYVGYLLRIAVMPASTAPRQLGSG